MWLEILIIRGLLRAVPKKSRYQVSAPHILTASFSEDIVGNKNALTSLNVVEVTVFSITF